DNIVYGGISLLHTMIDGKHHYEVKNVLTHTPSHFARKTDKLLKINNVETQNLPPDKFADMLANSPSPMLTIHQVTHPVSIEPDILECLESDFFEPCVKEKINMTFCMTMVTKECLDKAQENGFEPDVCEWESDDIEEDQKILLVCMNETRLTVMKGRGCDSDNPCHNCGTNRCNYNEVVVTADARQITNVRRECIMKSKEGSDWLNLTKSSQPDGPPVACPRTISVPMTIYFYKSNIMSDLGSGMPVVLNFSDTCKFLKCTMENQKVVLKAEEYSERRTVMESNQGPAQNEYSLNQCCEKKIQLRKICKDDENNWPFVFYMTTTKDDVRHFESAAHRGWFIQTTKQTTICVDQENNTEQKSFYFRIYYKSMSY
ncbi:hypothetical protein NFI96_014255, partial [Prochilodus magdalenae]